MLPVVSLKYLLLATCCLIQCTTSNILETREVCDSEVFSGRCGNDQVMVMRSARYGRMRLGRCVKLDLGYLGCSSDVLSLLDGWCSGRQSCEVDIDSGNEELFARRTCVVDISSHMEVEFACIRVATTNADNCRAGEQVELTAAQGALASHVVDDTGCGGLSTPSVLRASPGQRVQISMTDFGWTDESQPLTQAKCRLYGYISEPGFGANRTLCGGLSRERQIYMSSSNNVIIQLIPVQKREFRSAFLIQYSGCPDMKSPAHAWYKRNGSAAVIGCEWSEHSWHLRCEGNTWVGVVGKCSSGVGVTQTEPTSPWTISPLLSVSLIIGLGVLVVVLFCVALIGCICILRKDTSKSQGQPSGFQPTDQQQAFLYHPGRPVPMTHTGQVDGGATMGQSAVCTLHLVKPTPTDDLIHIWETPLPTPKQNQSSAGVTDNSTTMSGKSTLPGPPQVYKDGSTMSRSDYSTDTYWAGTDRYFDNDLGWVTMPPKQ